MITILLLVLAVVFVVGLAFWLMRPVKYVVEISDLQDWIHRFQEGFADGSLMFIDDSVSGRFIQFSKYSDHGIPLLRSSFPDAPWSHSFFHDLVSAFRQKSIPCSLRDERPNGGLRFVDINGIRGPREAMRIVEVVFEVMGAPSEGRVQVTFRGSHDPQKVRALWRSVKRRHNERN